MTHATHSNTRELTPAEMIRTNGGNIIAMAVADIVKTINDIDISGDPGCQHP